jgi:hypothetical protein
VLLGPIISRFFACSNEEKNKPKQQRVRALVLSLWAQSERKDRGMNGIKRQTEERVMDGRVV